MLSVYCADSLVKTVAAGINAPVEKNVCIKGLVGSQDAIILSAVFTIHPQDFIVILHDREEAGLFSK